MHSEQCGVRAGVACSLPLAASSSYYVVKKRNRPFCALSTLAMPVRTNTPTTTTTTTTTADHLHPCPCHFPRDVMVLVHRAT